VKYVSDRILVPQDIRERKGSFFTPQQWVELSQKYISDVLGEDWQDEYYIWDCAAGTGNLLAGLTNKYNIWASTLDKADVDVMKDRIKNGANLLENHVFQFDFLNDDFAKLPKGLQDIINNEKKRKKLVVYINPPYAEVSSKDIKKEQCPNPRGIWILYTNLIPVSIYYTIRHIIAFTWLNDRDQFLYPNDGWMNDADFQNDCLTFTIFNTNIQSKYGINHWIPFTEEDAKDNFESHFMVDYIKDKTIHEESAELFGELTKKHKALKFSDEAKAVFRTGKKLWQYYHSQPTANVNASLYDIREFFQGRDDNGKMNNSSGDTQYNELIGDLRSALKTLSLKIQPKVYEYGFLVK